MHVTQLVTGVVPLTMIAMSKMMSTPDEPPRISIQVHNVPILSPTFRLLMAIGISHPVPDVRVAKFVCGHCQWFLYVVAHRSVYAIMHAT